MRVRYVPGPLHEHEVDADPRVQVSAWLEAAVQAGLPEPNAMVLSTVGADGRPGTRIVLLKQIDERGYVFFTNTASRKGRDIDAHAEVALLFPWFPMARQVVVEGVAEAVDVAEADAYWATRPRESQLGAWASEQSRPIESREALHARLDAVTRRFAADTVLPRPPSWGGYRVVPQRIELWQGQPGRLHDRLRYERTETGWLLSRLQP
jgi:pyridoxamine 5'-phosphate oxidase